MKILYQDEFLVAVNKPAGLLVHRSALARGERQFAVQMLRDRLGRRVYPVHRLDRGTSGILLFALSPAVAGALAACFRSQTVGKHYLAVVRGYVPAIGVVDYPLGRKGEEAAGETPVCRHPRPALTHYRRLATVELPYPVGRYATSRYSLVAIVPRTGRRHQIRRHMKHIFHPLVGDTNYGEGRHNRFFREHFNCARLLLAAVQTNLMHPVTGRMLTISAPLDGAMSRVIHALGWRRVLPPSLIGGETEETVGAGDEESVR